MDTQRRLILLLLVVLAGALAPNQALAAGRTVYVDDNGAANAAGKGRCGKPNYNLIQAAVDDMSATRIIVCKGTYAEQVTVLRSLTLQGRSGAVIQAPTVLAVSGAIVRFSGAQQSRLKGFTISGASTTDEGLFVGVDVRDGAQVSIARNRISDIRGVGLASTQGIGISVDTAWADITDNIIERYGSGGILVASPTAFAMIDDNTIRGQQGPGINNGQIGINIREGGRGDVEDNTITGNKQDGNGAGIVVDQTDNVSLRDNTVTENDLGIVLGDETGDVEVRSNTIRNNTSHGVFLTDAGFNSVVENESAYNGGDGIRVETGLSDPNAFGNRFATNKVHHNLGDGIHLGLGVSNNTVKENRVTNNDGVDIVDENGTPLVNTYSDNTCGTSSPSGLCE